MDRVRLGVLPDTQDWNLVRVVLASGAAVNVVAGEVVKAISQDLQAELRDPAFARSFWLLCQIPRAARDPEFSEDLERFGLPVPKEVSLSDLRAAITNNVDRYSLAHGGSGDFGEMAQLAAVEALTATVGRSFASYFDIKPKDLQRELGRYTGGSGFTVLALHFFGRLVYRLIAFHVSQELSDEVGPLKRFKDDRARAEFLWALSLYSHKASEAVRRSTAEWYEGVVARDEDFTIAEARDFAARAFLKVLSEIEVDLMPFAPIPPRKAHPTESPDDGN